MHTTLRSRAFLIVAFVALLFPALASAQFKRGDANGDGCVDGLDVDLIADTLLIPGFPSPQCMDAADTNDDGLFNISDLIYIAAWLEIPSSPAPPAPGPFYCGVDPTDDEVGCEVYEGCGPCLPDVTGSLTAGDASAVPGATGVDHFILGSFDFDLPGFSVAIDYDETIITVESIDAIGTATEDAFFFGPMHNNDPGEGWFFVGALMDAIPPLDGYIPAGDNVPLVHTKFSVSSLAPLETMSTISVVDSIGTPEVATLFAVPPASLFVPDMVAGTFHVTLGVTGAVKAGDASGPPGATSVDHFVLATFDYALPAYTIAVEYDESLLNVGTIDPVGTGAESAEFFSALHDDAMGEGWFWVAALMDTSPPIDTFIPAGVDVPLIHTTFAVDAGAPPGTLSTISVVPSVGNPPVDTLFAVLPGFVFAPTMLSGTFEVTEGGHFVRGNCNDDALFDIGDPIFLLDVLFPPGGPGTGAIPSCEDSCDANDDGVIDIAHPISMLTALFPTMGLMPLPPPGPGVPPINSGDCGPDTPEDDALDCDPGSTLCL